MKPARSLHLPFAASLLIAFLVIAPRPLRAQTPPCTAADLDVTLHFGNYQSSTYIIAALSKNVSTHACSLDNLLAPTFYTYDQTAPLNISICVNCSQSSIPPNYPLLLQPNAIAHQTLRWSTTASSGAPACKKASVVNLPANGDPLHPAQVVAPSLLPPICSQVAEESYALGPTFGDDDDSAPSRTGPSSLHLSSGFFTYHPGDSFVLHAESLSAPQDMPAFQPGVAPRGPLGRACPSFFLRQRAPDGSTRFEEFTPRQYRCSMRATSGQPSQLLANFDAIPPLQPKLIGDTSLQISQLTSSLTDPRIAFLESNRITVRIAQESEAPRSADGTSRPGAYDGWRTDFSLVDTSLGQHSALLDQSTRLQWLCLDLTRNKSPKDLERDMSRRKPLDGWRFATADEVLTLFRHFTNSVNGVSTDPAVVHELQSLLGGPLGSCESTAGNWKRAFTYGRVVEPYNTGEIGQRVPNPHFQLQYAWVQEMTQNGETTAIADPHRGGAVEGNDPAAGTFLVREQQSAP